MAAFPYFDLIINYKGKVGRVFDVDPNMYCYIDALKDVTATVLSHISCSEAIAITLHCDMPGTDRRRLVENDLDVLDMFYVQGRSKTINLYVNIEYSIGMSDGGHKSNVGNENHGVDAVDVEQDYHTIDVDEEYHQDNVYGFSDEDRDWNATAEDENQSDANEILSDDDNECSSDDAELSDYQSGDDEVPYSSTDDDYDDEADCLDDEEMRFPGMKYDGTYNGKEPYMNQDGEVVLEEGMIFPEVNTFRATLRDYTVQTGFKIVRDKNEKSRVTAHCAAEGCPWRIHASPLPDGITYKIKTLVPTHTCSRMNTNTEATSAWIAKKMVESFKDNPHMGLDTMQMKLNKMFGIEASRMQLYRAKRRCKEELEGDHGSQYVLLPTYASQINKTNPGSLVVINYDIPSTPVSEDGEQPDPTIPQYPLFQRIFISFDAMKAGFINGCRLFIGVDRCHLKGPYGGVLISAVALDGNNGLFPLALAIVEGECKDSWSFFLHNLRTIIEDALPSRPWTIMSDQQKGLDKIVSDIIPEATHRRCCMHLYNNFRAKFPGLILRKQFWRAARAYNQMEYDKTMQAIKDLNNDACIWLQKKQLEVTQKWSRTCTVEYAGGNEYEVKDNEGVNHIVHIGAMTCVCRQWEISGLPCKHAVAAISHSRLNIEDFVHPYYSKATYLRANGGMIHPILHHSMWTLIPGDPLQPPPLKRLPGRPRTSRKRAAHEPPAGTSQTKRSSTLRCK
ncbi:uncharacterized protein LOC114313164 [Camellia sinensis]|uniref:uncharacterized protein LOC114313164 n=1 Tax=Camellia sinensis TaxID=4442 RepID=UPI0010363221|nr:uncharacterized protein LOC114313164 [Camellia sinensis]